jgi:hypothetical protein
MRGFLLFLITMRITIITRRRESKLPHKRTRRVVFLLRRYRRCSWEVVCQSNPREEFEERERPSFFLWEWCPSLSLLLLLCLCGFVLLRGERQKKKKQSCDDDRQWIWRKRKKWVVDLLLVLYCGISRLSLGICRLFFECLVVFHREENHCFRNYHENHEKWICWQTALLSCLLLLFLHLFPLRFLLRIYRICWKRVFLFLVLRILW